MKWYAILLSGAALALGAVGAIRGCEVEGGVEKKIRTVEIKMVPENVKNGNWGVIGDISIYGTTKINEEDVYISAYSRNMQMRMTDVASWVQGEISDKDNEAITLKGNWFKDKKGKYRFDFSGIEVNGCEFPRK